MNVSAISEMGILQRNYFAVSQGKAGIKLEDDPIGPETALVAEKELRETPERIQESCEQLRALMKGKTHFSSDIFLSLVLLGTIL